MSMTADGGEGFHVRHENRYREIMLEREEERSVFRIAEEVRPRFFFIDLLEERFDLLRRNGRYITDSDARRGAVPGAAGACLPDRIPAGSLEKLALFGKWSRVFAERIRECSPGVRFVVVENYLCTQHGTPGHLSEYGNADRIRESNRILAAHYAALREIIPGALWIRPADCEAISPYLFTDEEYIHGVRPEHVNGIANRMTAALAEKALFQE